MSKKEVFLIILACGVIAVIFSAAIIFGSRFLSSDDYEEYNDVENYQLYLEELKNNSDAHTGLYIFPKEVNIDSVEEFRYAHEDGVFDGSYLYYLTVSYNEEAYENEVNRIKKLSVKFVEEKKNILYAETGFNYPAYVSIFDGNGTYEYTLLNKEKHKIVYIYNQLFDFKHEGVNEEYTPQDYSVSKDKRDTRSKGYNMYYIYDSQGTGTMFNEYEK